MKILWISLVIANIALVSSRAVRDASEDEEGIIVTPPPADPVKDAADLELATTTAAKFAADLFDVRKTEDIQKLNDWLLDDMVFHMCRNHLYRGHFVAFCTNALINEEKYPDPLSLVPENAFTRGEYLSMVVKASGFVFEADDKAILDFKKQEDGSYKFYKGTVLTCREPEDK